MARVEVEAAERARVQAAWMLTGALDWARLILREDARAGGADHLAEPWAVPLQEARLSTFLAAEPGDTADATSGTDADNAFLSGQIIDLQSLLNVNNLLEAGRVSETGVAQLPALFELLGLPQSAARPPGREPALRLGHQRRQPLGDAGAADAAAGRAAGLAGPVARDRGGAQPYVTLLPARTPVNLNTASAEVIYAAVNGSTMADAQRLVAARERAALPQHRRCQQAAAVPRPRRRRRPGTVGVASQLLRGARPAAPGRAGGRGALAGQRDGLDVRTLQRERGVRRPRSWLALSAGRGPVRQSRRPPYNPRIP